MNWNINKIASYTSSKRHTKIVEEMFNELTNAFTLHFSVDSGEPLITSVNGDVEGLLGFTIDEFSKINLQQHLGITKEVIDKTIERLSDSGWMYKEMRVKGKSGKLASVGLLLYNISQTEFRAFMFDCNKATSII